MAPQGEERADALSFICLICPAEPGGGGAFADDTIESCCEAAHTHRAMQPRAMLKRQGVQAID